MTTSFFRFFALFVALGSFSQNALAKNFHPIEEASKGVKKLMPGEEKVHPNYGMYRTGRPLNAAEFDDMVCGPEGHPEQAVSEIWVLSDKYGSDEKQYNDPKSEIWKRPENAGYKRRCDKTIAVQNFNQSVRDSALTESFLKKFDEYVKNARKDGRKIAFRCDCGCHRTGRLAAYYEMKYMDKSVDQAMENMTTYAHGKPDAAGRAVYWWLIKHKLKKQTEALYDYAHGEKCSTRKKFCVVPPEDEAKSQLLIGKSGKDYDDMTTEELLAAARAEGNVESSFAFKDLPASGDGDQKPAGEASFKSGDI